MYEFQALRVLRPYMFAGAGQVLFSGLARDIMICSSHYGSRLQSSRFFFSKSVKKSIKRSKTFCLTSRAYLNTQKYGLFCSPLWLLYRVPLCRDPTLGFKPEIQRPCMVGVRGQVLLVFCCLKPASKLSITSGVAFQKHLCCICAFNLVHKMWG